MMKVGASTRRWLEKHRVLGDSGRAKNNANKYGFFGRMLRIVDSRKDFIMARDIAEEMGLPWNGTTRRRMRRHLYMAKEAGLVFVGHDPAVKGPMAPMIAKTKLR